jgi:hypothetical protein
MHTQHIVLQTRLHLLLTLSLIAQFTKLSGGLEGGANPPAFQRAENKRLEAAKRAEEAAAVKEAALEESLCDTQNSEIESTTTPKKVIYRLAWPQLLYFSLLGQVGWWWWVGLGEGSLPF